MYDAVNVVVNAVKQLQRTGAPRLRVANLSCDELHAWSHGSSLYNYINMASLPLPAHISLLYLQRLQRLLISADCTARSVIGY